MGLIQPTQSTDTSIVTPRRLYFVAALIICSQLCSLVGASNPTKKQTIRRRQSQRVGKPTIRNLFREIDSDLVASSTVESAFGLEDLESNGPETTVTENNDQGKENEDNGSEGNENEGSENEGDDNEDDSENEGPTPSEPEPTPPPTPQPVASAPEPTPPPTPKPVAGEPEPTPPPTPQPVASAPEPTPPPTPKPVAGEPEPTPPPTPQPVANEPEPTPPPTPQPVTSESEPTPPPTPQPVANEPEPTPPPTPQPVTSAPEPTPPPTPVVTRRPTNQPTSSPGESKEPTRAPISPGTTPDPTPAPIAASATDTPTPAPVIIESTPLPSRAVTRRPTIAPTSLATGAPIVGAPITNAPITSAPATKAPTDRPTNRPTNRPTQRPTRRPTNAPTSMIPSDTPSETIFTGNPTKLPSTDAPTFTPTKNPTDKPASSPTRNPTSAPSGAPTRPDRVPLESLEAPVTATPSPSKLKTSAPTFLPSATQEPTTNKPTQYSFSFSRDDMERLDSMNGSVNLQFSLLFPNSQVSNMNITKVENAVLSSLEHLYCDPRRHEDFRDDHCLLKSDLVNMDPIDGAIQQRQQEDGSDLSYSILGIPYVTHLDERYANDDGRDSWTTWKVSWDIVQFGTPLLERAILAMDPEIILSLQEVFTTGVQAMQEIAETAMDDSIGSGNFDAALARQVDGIAVQSSAVNKEMETFNFVSSDSTIDGSENTAEGDSSSDRNTAAIVAFVVLVIFVVVSLAAYFTLKPRSPKTDWKREQEQKIIESIEYEAALERESSTVPHTVKISAGSKQVGSISTASKLMGSIDGSKGQNTAQVDLLSLDNGSRQIASIDGSKGQENTQGDLLSLDNDESLPFSAAHVIHNLEDKLDREPDDQGSTISSLDYNWSVDGVDAPWKSWPINKRAPYLQDAPSLEDSPSLEKVPAPVKKPEPAITRGANDTLDV